jgi:cysteine desulfurase/selenocysteine lyase
MLGGGTVSHVDFDHYVCKSGPERIEAGTQNISGVHSLGAAAEWIQEVSYKDIQECEAEFFNMIHEKGLFSIEEMQLIGPIQPRSVYTFVSEHFHPSDIAGILDMSNVCVRTGHMCAYPASNKYSNGKGVLRISTAPYNDEHDCVMLVEGLWKAIKKLSKTK